MQTLPEFDYDWHYDYIKRIVISYLKSGQSIDDLIHACMERILKYREDFDPSKMKYTSWVFMMAKSAAIDTQSNELDNARLLTYSGVEVYSQTEICTPENEYESKELALWIYRAIQSLPTNQRLVMEKYEYEQIPLYKVADELGLQYNHVRNLHSYAKQAVDKAIKEYYCDD